MVPSVEQASSVHPSGVHARSTTLWANTLLAMTSGRCEVLSQTVTLLSWLPSAMQHATAGRAPLAVACAMQFTLAHSGLGKRCYCSGAARAWPLRSRGFSRRGLKRAATTAPVCPTSENVDFQAPRSTTGAVW